MPSGVIGLEGFKNPAGGLTVTKNYVSRFELPANFSSSDLNLAATDCELFAKLLKAHPDEMLALVQACLNNDTATAQKLALKVGFTEEYFTSQGGGFWHLLIVVVVVGGHFLKWW